MTSLFHLKENLILTLYIIRILFTNDWYWGDWSPWTDQCRANNYIGAEVAVYRPVGAASVSVTGITGDYIWGSNSKGNQISDNRGALNIRMWCTDGSYHQTALPPYMSKPAR